MSDESLWIFGYGSLVWRPAFSHLRRRPAYIDGYARRFWQGSTDHRGVPGRPGRVVTLISDTHGSVSSESNFRAVRCWGTAYEVPVADPNGVLAGLDHRERGGYERLELEVLLGAVEADNRGDSSLPRPEARFVARVQDGVHRALFKRFHFFALTFQPTHRSGSGR